MIACKRKQEVATSKSPSGSNAAALASENQADTAAREDAEDANLHDEPVIKKLLELMKAERTEVSTCAGVVAEDAALVNKEEELRSARVSREEARAQLQPLHEALRAKIQANQSKMKTCLEANKTSSNHLSIKNLIESCWEKPGQGRSREFAPNHTRSQERPRFAQGKGPGQGRGPLEGQAEHGPGRPEMTGGIYVYHRRMPLFLIATSAKLF